MRSYVLAGVCLAIGAIGCPDHTVSKVTTVPSGVNTKSIPLQANLDVLFVIDNSPSTADKQLLFAANFSTFVQSLRQFPNAAGGGSALPNLHIGVVSSTVGLQSTNVYALSNCPQTSSTDDGRLQTAPRVTGCTPPSAAYISDLAGSGSDRITNYSGALEDELACIAEIGADGCGFEAQLEGMKRALDGSQPGNSGFLRPDAYLAVIFLTDEDDCSVKDPSIFTLDPSTVGGSNDFRCQPMYAYQCDTPITTASPATYTNCVPASGANSKYLQDTSYYYDFLSTLKDPSQIVVAMVAGDATSTIHVGEVTIPETDAMQNPALEPSCMAMIGSAMTIGRPGVRLADFTSRFGKQGLFTSVCQSSYATVFQQIGQLLFNAISPCLEGTVDPTDQQPDNPGFQPDCVVDDVLGSAESPILPCAMIGSDTPDPNGARPCWWVAPSTACSGSGSGMTGGLSMHIERGGVTPPDGTTQVISCATD